MDLLRFKLTNILESEFSHFFVLYLLLATTMPATQN